MAARPRGQKEVRVRHTINDVLRVTTLDYLAGIDPKTPPAPDQIEDDLLQAMKANIDLENAMRAKNDQLKCPQKLDPAQIATVMATLYPICTVQTGGTGSDRSYDLLAMYMDDGPSRGIYVTDDEIFRTVMRQYNYTMRTNDIKEAVAILRNIVPCRTRCREPNLIAVNNGIFDYDTKTLMPFTPELVFLTKSGVDYVDNPVNPIIHNPDDGTDWDMESWMKELSDDPEVVELLWQILGAIIRPLVPWNKSAWFYSEKGNNGKGTLCELMRQLCGENAYAAIKLSDMSTDFLLEPLLHASAIITDENDVGAYIDKAANLKSIVTGDVIQVNRKFKTPVAYQFFGFMVQCFNEMPRIKDKSDSFFRRQLFIPFSKCFTGIERKYIKRDYLHRPEVLQYVLWRVLNMNYYELSEPEACKLALEEYKEFNDPVRQFAEDVLPEAKWDLLPFDMLYDAYKVWFKRNVPSGTVQSKNSFITDLIAAVQDNPDWECEDRRRQVRGAKRMECFEPLLGLYGMSDWMNPRYANSGAATPEQRCTPLAGQYARLKFRGLVRAGTVPDDDVDN